MAKAKIAKTASEYLVYTRRSTDDQVHQKNSIDYQIMQCQHFADNLSLPIADYNEDGFSENGIIQERHTAFKTSALDIAKDGTVRYRIDRPRFQKLVAALSSGRFKGVICLCWDRISRNPHDDAVVKDLLARGADIRFVQATYDNSSAGALHMDIDGMFAAHYSRTMSDKIRGANAKLRAEGKCTGPAPIGYLNDGTGKKPIDPERAPVIRRLFELYATGEWSLAQLTRWARNQGLTSRARLRKTQKGQADSLRNKKDRTDHPVLKRSIEIVLHNPFYAGFVRHNGVEFAGVHKPIISRDLFDKVQLIQKKRNTSIRYAEEIPFCYRGLIKCSCGRSYSPYLQKSYVYYGARCQGACGNPVRNLAESRIDGLLMNLFERLQFSDEEVALLREKAPSFFAKADMKRNAAERTLEKRRNKLSRDLSYLDDNKITLLQERVYTPADISREMSRLRQEFSGLKTQATNLINTDEQEKLDTVLHFSELIPLASSALKVAKAPQKRELVTTLFSELVVENGIVAGYSAKPGVEKLLKRPLTTSGGPGGNRTHTPCGKGF